MWLREVVFQGIFGVDKPARIRVERGHSNLKLPAGIDPVVFQRLIFSVIFPGEVPQSELAAVADGDGSGLRLGLIVEVEARSRSVYKVFRRLEDESIVVKDVTDPAAEVGLASGLEAAREVIAERLFVPSAEDFQLLHMWRLVSGAPSSAPSSGDPEVDRLLGLYRDARELERLERELDEIRSDITEAERELSRLGAPSAPRGGDSLDLTAFRALTAQDRAFVKTFEDVRADLEEKLAARQMEADDAVRRGRPVPWQAEYLLWGAAGGALLIYILSAATGVRGLALINVILLGVCASSLLRRFSRIEAEGAEERRIQQLSRRVELVAEEQRVHEQRLSTLLGATGSRNLDALREGIAELERAEVRGEPVEKVEEEGEEDADLQSHVASVQARVTGHREKFEAVERQRAAVPDSGMASYELEHALEERGVDPAQEAVMAASSEPSASSWFVQGQRLAAARGLFVMGKLIEKTATGWSKLASHLVGPQWQGLHLSADGQLRPPPDLGESPEERFERNPAEAELLGWALMAAIFATTATAHPLNQCRFLCLANPGDGAPEVSERLAPILKSLATQANVLVLRRG